MSYRKDYFIVAIVDDEIKRLACFTDLHVACKLMSLLQLEYEKELSNGSIDRFVSFELEQIISYERHYITCCLVDPTKEELFTCAKALKAI